MKVPSSYLPNLALKKSLLRALLLSFCWIQGGNAAPGEPLVITVATAPTVTGSGVGQVVVFEDAGWLDTNDNKVFDGGETQVDLRGEVMSVTGTPNPTYAVTGDDFRVRLEGVGQVSIRWSIHEAVAGSGNGATGTQGVGSPNILVKDIDGPNIEHVGSNLNNLKSYSVEAGPPASDLVPSTATVPFIIFSGTGNHTAADTESMAKFSWEDVSYFEIFYEAESGGRNYDQDGDGDITFVSENIVDLPPTVSNTSGYINDANKAAYSATGTCTAAGNDITVTLDDTVTTIGPLATTCTQDGTFTVTTDVTSLIDGSVTITTQIDDGFNPAVTDIDSVTKDTVAPVVPPTEAPDLTNGTDSGSNNTDDVTNISSPDFTVACTNGNTVNLYVNAVAAGTASCSGGSATVTATQTLNEGVNSITFSETDPYENQSGVSPSLSVTLETVASGAPTITAPSNGSSVPAVNTVTGSCVTGETVSVANAHLVLSPVQVSCLAGAYSANVTFAPAADGNAEVLSVTQTDYVGNVSPAATVTVNVDSTAPGNGSTSVLNTNDNTPAIGGTLAAPTNGTDTLQVTIDGTTYPATNNGNGTWTLSDNTITSLADGAYSVTVVVTDAVGNSSTNMDANVITVDTVAPMAPTVDAPANGTIVSTQTPTLSGSGAAPGDTITVTGALGETCSVVVGGTGAWSCALAPALAEGGPQNLSVTATDPVGNESSPSVVSVTIDTTNPAPPVVSSPNHGDYTNDTTPHFSGTGEIGATVNVDNGTGGTCTTVVDGTGNWNCDITPAIGAGSTHNFVITQTDGGGNTSSQALIDLIIDTTSPTIIVARASGQAATTAYDQAKFVLTFNEAIEVSSLTAGDILLIGTTGLVTAGPTQIAPNDGTTFEITITGMTDGDTVTASVPIGSINDLAGNLNQASTGVSNTVTFDTTVDSDGDGLSDLVEAQLGTNPNLNDSDSDGNNDDNNDLDNIHPLVELAAPNNGDGNGDGFIDAVQNSVSSRPNTLTGTYNSLETANSGVTNCGQIARFDSLEEGDLGAADEEGDYPLGLWDFEIQCTNPGDTASIVIYLDKQYDTTNWVYKKYNNNTQQYVDMSGLITYGTANVGAAVVTTIQYSVTDGGPYDEDGLANAVIVDPSGPSINTVVTVPSQAGTPTGGRGRYAGQTRAEYQASQQYAGEVTKHNFAEAYAFSQQQVAQLNAPRAAQILTYTDAQGVQQFRGYIAGSIGIESFQTFNPQPVVWRQREPIIEGLVGVEAFHGSAPSQTEVDDRLSALYKNILPGLNKTQETLLESAPRASEKSLKRTTDVNTIVNRQARGVSDETYVTPSHVGAGRAYTRPEHPGWNPLDPNTDRKPIERNLIELDGDFMRRFLRP